MRKYLLVSSLVVLTVCGLILPGCLIDAPEQPNKVPSVLTLQPSYLEQLPEGSIYEGWLANGEVDDQGEWVPDDRTTWVRFGRFNWDPYSHVPTDVSGSAIENRFVTGVDIYSYDRILITVESTTNTSGLSSGIVILQGEVDEMNQDADLEHPINTSGINDFVEENWFYIFSQSDGRWYDYETVENGIWFGRVDTADVVWFDTQGVTYYCDVDTTDEENWEECENIPPADYDSIYCKAYGSDTLCFYFCQDTLDDTLVVLQECERSYDSLFYFEVVHVDTNGDTTITPSLTSMPVAADGWEYEVWITFTDDSPYKDPLSLGRFADPEGPDDDTSYTIISGYDRHFSIPGEDLFQNVPYFGRLDIVASPYPYKIFITVEPEPDFDQDEPFWQLIIFSAYIPKHDQFYDPLSGLPNSLRWPLVLRDIGYELNEGHRWPTMHIELERELVID